jgi:hypothetical protein
MTRLVAAVVCVLVLGGCPEESDGGAGDGAEADAGPVFEPPPRLNTSADFCAAYAECQHPGYSDELKADVTANCPHEWATKWGVFEADQCWDEFPGGCDWIACMVGALPE